MVRCHMTFSALALVFATGNALAQVTVASEDVWHAPISVKLDYAAPEGCSDRSRFESGLRERFARIRIFETSDAQWRLDVRLTVHGDRVHGELRILDAAGQSELRAVDGNDCSGVAEALSLTAALAIEQTTALGEPHPTETTTPVGAPNVATSGSATIVDDSGKKGALPAAPEPKPGGPLPSDPSTKQMTARPAEWRFSAGVFAADFVSSVTSIGAQIQARYVARLSSSFHPEFGLGAAFVPVDLFQPKETIAVSYRGGSGLVCPVRLRLAHSVSVLPCVTLDVGRLTTSARDVNVSTPSRRLQLSPGVDLKGLVELGHGFALEVAGGLKIPTVRREYVTFDSSDVVGRTPIVMWAAGLGIVRSW